ncbi:hypothetical protein KNV89_19635 [Dickeya dadantii]|nr:hypothetical protein KNV89_19635 [Dickeya dadantii]
MIMFTPWLTPPTIDNDGSEANKVGYESLTPTELEPEKASSYVAALNYAFDQRDIRNIAVTGPYGAGKSSVLKTWCKTKEDTLRMLTVSLADFDMQKSTEDGNTDCEGGNAGGPEKSATTEEKSIEYSILQQILYKNKKNELPYSRIERISGVTVGQTLKSATVLTGTMLLAGVALFFLVPDYVTAKLSLPETFSRYLLECPFKVRLAGTVLSMVSSLGLLLNQLHRIGIFDRKVSLDKVDIFKGAVTTKASSPSLLNVYIDEIVYFFDSTKYDVVIFEDLDRLNNHRIFTKLREINQIINNCLSEKKPLKFIYAIRDNLFNSAESRTKFFDFIIPVIPVMDNENAAAHFSKKFTEEEKSQEGLNECISRISTFIPDMRVMHNITNEFRLYQNIVNSRENLSKLLAMIAYKNICAEDYHGIDSKTGTLYNFTKSFVEHRVQNFCLRSINSDLKELRDKLDSIESERNIDRQSLRKELLSPYINEQHKDLLVFYADEKWKLEQAIKDEEVFLSIVSNREIQTMTVSNNQYFLKTKNNPTKQIKDEYSKRCSSIDSKKNGESTSLTNKISELGKLKNKINTETISEISIRMTNPGFSEWLKENNDECHIKENDNNEQNDFIYFLLSSGYLSTDYMSYRSIFMAGGLSESDNTFIKAVMAGNGPEKTFNYSLDKIDNVIKRLRKLGVMHRANAQHPLIALWLLDNDSDVLIQNLDILLDIDNKEKTIELFSLLQKDWIPELRIRFIIMLISNEKLLGRLLSLLCDFTNRSVTQEMTAHLFCIKDVCKKIGHEVNFYKVQKLFSVLNNLLSCVPTEYGNIFINNIKMLKIPLGHLQLTHESEQQKLLRDIVSNRLFTYRDSNIENICRSLCQDINTDKGTFLRHPLSMIESLDIPALKEEIDANMGAFISSFFIQSAEIERIPQLLDSKYVSLKMAELIINSMDFKIEHLEKIPNREEEVDSSDTGQKLSTYSLLLQNKKISPTPFNFAHLLHVHSVDISNDVVLWANENHKTLINYNIVFSSTETFDNFLSKFISSPLLHEDTLLTVMKSCNFCITEVPKTIPLRNAEILFSEGKLAPIINVFTGLYNALSSNVDNKIRMNTLLSNLIAEQPELLLKEPEEIFYVGRKFDAELARNLFRHHKISVNIRVRAMRWLRDNDPNLLGSIGILSLQTLAELSPGMFDDALRLPLLRVCLTSGDADKEILRVVLDSFADENYRGLLPQERFRKIPYSADLWSIAELISNVDLISPPKMGTGRDKQKMVINPARHNHEDCQEE